MTLPEFAAKIEVQEHQKADGGATEFIAGIRFTQSVTVSDIALKSSTAGIDPKGDAVRQLYETLVREFGQQQPKP